MVIVKLNGGLGNQLFQYAAGRRLAHIHSSPIKLDITGFEKYKRRKYELAPFRIQEDIATDSAINELVKAKRIIPNKRIRELFKINKKTSKRLIKEKHFHFDPSILALPDNVYLEGFWQSEKYFVDIEEIIREEFTLRKPPTGRNKEIFELIHSVNSISIHFRRGDYVTDEKSSETHGALPLKYYYQCVEHIIGQISNPFFFIFSDEPQWCRNHFRLEYPYLIVDYNSEDTCPDDLRLMSFCNHNIIANSSFSWWAAWLNSSKDKLVYAPRAWFNKKANNTSDLIPAGWIQI